MANDSQRGYLSGIVQRGARIVSPFAQAAPMRPFESALSPTIAPAVSPAITPTVAPALDSPVPISSDLPNEIETFIEFASPQRSWDDDRAGQQPDVTAPLPAGNAETTAASTAPSEKRELAAPGNPQKLDPVLTERNDWGERLPRLIRVNTEKLSRDPNQQASTATEQIATVVSSPKQIIPPVLTVEAFIPPAESIAHSADSLVHRVEKADTEATSHLPRNDQTFAERRIAVAQFQPATPYTSTPIASQSLASVDQQPPDPAALRETLFETEREVVVVQALPEQSETFATWKPSLVQRDELSMARPSPSPRQESPKLTINRLDVQIVNQSVPPVAPPPPLPAPAPQPDGWNNLERYHLGHLDLIL